MGDLKEALAAGVEAVSIYRTLAEASPGAFTSQLARSLTILSLCLIDAGKRAEALAPAKEVVEIRRALAEANPKASNPDLALSLVNLFISLSRRQKGRSASANPGSRGNSKSVNEGQLQDIR